MAKSFPHGLPPKHSNILVVLYYQVSSYIASIHFQSIIYISIGLIIPLRAATQTLFKHFCSSILSSFLLYCQYITIFTDFHVESCSTFHRFGLFHILFCPAFNHCAMHYIEQPLKKLTSHLRKAVTRSIAFFHAGEKKM